MRAWLFCICSLPAMGCFESPVAQPLNRVVITTPVSVNQAAQNKVDLLFMVDNSGSMKLKQQQLNAQFKNLIGRLDDFAAHGRPASYHIGVVTSDYGTGANKPTMNKNPHGDGGNLVNVGAAAAMDCRQIDTRMRVNGDPSGNFIVYDQTHPGADGKPSNNFPSGQDLAKTFTCMASVGDGGCGMEHQLESVYQALKPAALAAGQNNAGFLRPEALLVVVFVTDEDDCSAPDDDDLFSNDMATLPDGMKAFDALGTYQSFRCTEWGIKCNGKRVGRGKLLATNGCEPLTRTEGGRLYDISRYTDFFFGGASRGVKSDPKQVILASIAAPPYPFETLFTTNNRARPYPQDPAICDNVTQLSMDGKSCSVVLKPSCAPNDPNHSGDPAVRLNWVVSHQDPENLPKSKASICDNDYSATLNDIADKIVNAIKPSCVPPFDNPDRPQCLVEDHIHDCVSPALNSRQDYSFCDNVNHQTPCWRTCQVASTDGGCAVDQVLVKLCRQGDPSDATCAACDDTPPAALPGAGCKLETKVECATLAQ